MLSKLNYSILVVEYINFKTREFLDMTKKSKKFKLSIVFNNLDDLLEHVRISCALDLTIKKADYLDLHLPYKHFKIEEYVLKKIPAIKTIEHRGVNGTSN